LTRPIHPLVAARRGDLVQVMPLERVDPFHHHGMKSVVLPATDLLPASSIATTNVRASLGVALTAAATCPALRMGLGYWIS